VFAVGHVVTVEDRCHFRESDEMKVFYRVERCFLRMGLPHCLLIRGGVPSGTKVWPEFWIDPLRLAAIPLRVGHKCLSGLKIFSPELPFPFLFL
jgi:hypothetical protein